MCIDVDGGVGVGQASTRASTDGLLVVDVSTVMPASSLLVDGTVALKQRAPLGAASGHRLECVSAALYRRCIVPRYVGHRLQCVSAALYRRCIVPRYVDSLWQCGTKRVERFLSCALLHVCTSSTQLSSSPALPLASARGVEDMDVTALLTAYHNRNGVTTRHALPSILVVYML